MTREEARTIAELEKQLKSLRFEVKFIEAIFMGYCVIRILAIMEVLS